MPSTRQRVAVSGRRELGPRRDLAGIATDGSALRWHPVLDNWKRPQFRFDGRTGRQAPLVVLSAGFCDCDQSRRKLWPNGEDRPVDKALRQQPRPRRSPFFVGVKVSPDRAKSCLV